MQRIQECPSSRKPEICQRIEEDHRKVEGSEESKKTFVTLAHKKKKIYKRVEQNLVLQLQNVPELSVRVRLFERLEEESNVNIVLRKRVKALPKEADVQRKNDFAARNVVVDVRKLESPAVFVETVKLEIQTSVQKGSLNCRFRNRKWIKANRCVSQFDHQLGRIETVHGNILAHLKM
jgi:hypothetical protein